MKDFFFDYIYYRLYKFYYKWDGEHGITAVMGVSMIQALIIGSIIVGCARLFFSNSELIQQTKVLGYSGVIILFLIIWYNYKKYKGKYLEFTRRWNGEPKKRRLFKGILVIFFLVLSWLPLILMGTL